MIHTELKDYTHHYTLLILFEALLLTAFILSGSQSHRMWIAGGVGVVYTLWGIYSHKKQLQTFRLVIEYACVGLLATLILLSLVKSM